MEVVEAASLKPLLFGHLLVADGALGRNLGQKPVALRVPLAGGRAWHPTVLALFAARRALRALGLGWLVRALLTQLAGSSVCATECALVVPPRGRALLTVSLDVCAQRAIHRRKEAHRQTHVHGALVLVLHFARHKAAHAEELSQKSRSALHTSRLLHCCFLCIVRFVFTGAFTTRFLNADINSVLWKQWFW